MKYRQVDGLPELEESSTGLRSRGSQERANSLSNKRGIRGGPNGSVRLVMTAVVAFAIGVTTQRYSGPYMADLSTKGTRRTFPPLNCTSKAYSNGTGGKIATIPAQNGNVVYGHIHIAKTAGTYLNGKLATRFERVCGHKGYSYDAALQNQRVNELVRRNIAGALYHEQDSLHTLPYRDTYKDTYRPQPSTKRNAAAAGTSRRYPPKHNVNQEAITTSTRRQLLALRSDRDSSTPFAGRTPAIGRTRRYATRASTSHPQHKMSSTWRGYNRGRVPAPIMFEIGFHDCDWISIEDPGWNAWPDQVLKQLQPHGVHLELHVPCRDPLDHLLSQCNHRQISFPCDLDEQQSATNGRNITMEQQIDQCMVLIRGRFSYNLTRLHNTDMKCYDVSQTTQYQEYMAARLQPKRIPVDYMPRESNKKRVTSMECLKSAPVEFQQRVLRYMLDKYDYFSFCHDCMGSSDELQLASLPGS